MKNNKESFAVDLSNCDKEPIHILGKVQSHSVLLTVSEPELLIEQISENCEEHFGFPHNDLIFLTEKMLY